MEKPSCQGNQTEDTKMKKHRSISAVLFCFILLTLLPETTSGAVPDHWTERSFDLSAVAYGNGLFVAVGGNGRIQTSPDGVSWKIQTSGTAENLRGIAFGNGLFVAVGLNGTILSSGDGITWIAQNSGISQSLSAVTYGNGLFVAVGMGGIILSSPGVVGRDVLTEKARSYSVTSLNTQRPHLECANVSAL
jgi:hypothetical protein